MSLLQHGILFAKFSSLDHNLTGFYFTPIGGETKCFFLNQGIRCNRTVPLSKVLTSGAFSKISYRELLNESDAKRFKLALVNMQNSFDFNLININNHANVCVDHVSKIIGQNPAERIKQCSGECYVGPVPNIKSYDPFGQEKIYHRDIPLISREDQIWIYELAPRSYSESIPNVTFVKPNIISEHSIKPNDTLFQAFLINMIDDGLKANDVNPIKLPLSFRVPEDYIFNNINEKITTTWGLNIYHGSCWEIALWLLHDYHTILLDELRSGRKTTQFASIISNNINSPKANAYLTPIIITDKDDNNPRQRTLTYPYDPNGFAFYILSNYYSYDNINHSPKQWNDSAIYWNDFKPTIGENAWFFGLGPYIRKFNIDNFKGYSGFISTLFNMMDTNGGFYHSPINNSNTCWSLLTQDNAVMYSALSHIKSHQLTKFNKSWNMGVFESITKIGISLEEIDFMMKGIKQLLFSLIDRERFLFYQGKTWNVETSTWDIISKDLIIVNAHIWSICALQPLIIDEIFGMHGSSLKMWNNLKQICGKFNNEGELNGFGYNNTSKVISAETTFAAMLACKILKIFYQDEADAPPYSLSSDLAEMESFIYTVNSGKDGDAHLLFVSDNEAYFNHVNILSDNMYPIPSICATAWHIFYSKSFNPFIPDGFI